MLQDTLAHVPVSRNSEDVTLASLDRPCPLRTRLDKHGHESRLLSDVGMALLSVRAKKPPHEESSTTLLTSAATFAQQGLLSSTCRRPCPGHPGGPSSTRPRRPSWHWCPRAPRRRRFPASHPGAPRRPGGSSSPRSVQSRGQ